MSFGYSAGDFVAIGTLAWNVYKSCREAPENFGDIAFEVASLQAVLREAEETVFAQHLSPTRQRRLTAVADGCYRVLKDLDSLVENYQSLGTQSKRTWDRMKWGTEDIADLRTRLTLNIGLLTAWISMSQANVEKRLAEYAREFREGKRQGSVTSIQTLDSLRMDEKQVWRTIRKDLEDIGISVATFDANKKFIFDWFAKEVANGAFEEQSFDDPLTTAPCEDSSDDQLNVVTTVVDIASPGPIWLEAQFEAPVRQVERPDELDAKRGDPISVIALMDSGDLPKVEDLKRATVFNCKANNIALGVIEDSSVLNSPFTPPSDASTTVRDPQPYQDRYKDASPPRSTSRACLPDGILLSADVVSFHFEMEEFWFRIDAMFQPYAPPRQRSLPSARQLVLFRVYKEFYDFQVILLQTFPREAARNPPNPSLIPYMPGPVNIVDEQITLTRRAQLDDYLHKLCDLRAAGARYILEHRVVREFLALRPGDVDNEAEPRNDLMEEIFDYQRADGNDHGSDMRNKMERMKIREGERSDGFDGDDEGYAPPPLQPTNRHPYVQAATPRRPPAGESQNHSLHPKVRAQNHQRKGSTASPHRIPSPTPYRSSSRSNSPLGGNSPLPSSGYNPSRSDADTGHAGDHSRWANNPALPSPSSANSSSRTRSHSNAVSNLNNHPISAANPQTAFVKIKVFDRVGDDLIAIRVHPRVTYAELMDKIQARLGKGVAKLQYKDSLKPGKFVDLNGDWDLRVWLEGTDNRVLYPV